MQKGRHSSQLSDSGMKSSVASEHSTKALEGNAETTSRPFVAPLTPEDTCQHLTRVEALTVEKDVGEKALHRFRHMLDRRLPVVEESNASKKSNA